LATLTKFCLEEKKSFCQLQLNSHFIAIFSFRARLAAYGELSRHAQGYKHFHVFSGKALGNMAEFSASITSRSLIPIFLCPGIADEVTANNGGNEPANHVHR